MTVLHMLRFDLRRRRAASSVRRIRRRCRLEVLDDRVLLSTGLTNLYINHLSGDLIALYDSTYPDSPIVASTYNSPVSAYQLSQISRDAQGRVGVTITAQSVTALLPMLESTYGFQEVASAPTYLMTQGYLPIDELPAVTSLVPQGLLGVVADYPGQPGSFNDQAVNVLEADRVTATPNLPANITGAGVTVGVLSDSFNALGGAAAEEADGDLPPTVNVLQDELGFIPGQSPPTDEGRAMLELVHQVAPGAAEDFATAAEGETTFADNIQALANAGAKVIADDWYYIDEPMFQPGIIANAMDTVVTDDGVSYFSFAGNFGNHAYLNTSPSFIAGTVPGVGAGTFLNFTPGSGTNFEQGFSLTANQEVQLALQWDNPFYTAAGVTTSLNLYIVNTTTNTVVASAVTDATATQTPEQIVFYENNGSSTASYAVVIQLAKGPAPGALKWLDYGAGRGPAEQVAFQYAGAPAIVAHAEVADAMAVAAAPYYNQTTPEAFSSEGPAMFLFAPDKSPLATPEIVAKPNIMAIDGTDTSFFGNVDPDEDGLPNFFGTSAATPQAAGVAALMLQADPSLTPAQLDARMEATATPVSASPDIAGGGLLDAYRAVFGNPVPATLPFGDNFATGAPEQPWTLYKAGSGAIEATTLFGPGNGSEALALETSIDRYPNSLPLSSVDDGSTGAPLPVPLVNALDEAILHVDAVGQSNVTLKYEVKAFDSVNEAAAAAMPASFVGNGDYDGVSFSADGNTWYRLENIDIADPANQTFQTFNFNLSQIAQSLGVTLSADTEIKFQHDTPDNWQLPHDGIAVANVSVSSPALISGFQHSGIHEEPTQIVLTFDQAMDPASVEDTSNYLVRTGPHDHYRIVRIRSATYSAATHTVTLVTAQHLNIHYDYKLIVNASGPLGVQNEVGLALDGAGTGTPGTPYVKRFGPSSLVWPEPAAKSLLGLTPQSNAIPPASAG